MTKGDGEHKGPGGKQDGGTSQAPETEGPGGDAPGGLNRSPTGPGSSGAPIQSSSQSASKPRYSGLIKTGTSETSPSWTSRGSAPAQAPLGATSPGDTTEGTSDSGGRIGLYLLLVGVIIVFGGIAFFVVRSRSTPAALEAAKGTPELGQPQPPAVKIDVGKIADQALEMVHNDRFAVALGLLEEARAHAGTPIDVAVLREKEALVRLAMAKKLLERGNEVAARTEFERVLSLAPGDAAATRGLAMIKVKQRAGALKGKQIKAQPARGRVSRVHKRTKPARSARASSSSSSASTPAIPAPAKAPASKPRLIVLSNPTATVRLDGAPIGVTPLRGIVVSAGMHQLIIEAPGHQTQKRTIEAAAGKVSSLSVTLKQIEQAKPALSAGTAPKKKLEIPKLTLPAKLTLPLFKADGKRNPALSAVCVGVERTVSRAMGRSAAGKTRSLQEHLYSTGEKVATVYPRAMGYVIALALATGKPNVSSILTSFQKNGRLAALTRSNWRPSIKD